MRAVRAHDADCTSELLRVDRANALEALRAAVLGSEHPQPT